MSDQKSEVCDHLKPIFDFFDARGFKVEDVTLIPETGYKIVYLDVFVYRKDILSLLKRSTTLEWSWADPHYGSGNSILCNPCKICIEGKFDLSDPSKTLGE